MQTHSKKRIEIVVEAPLLKRLIELLEESPVNGFTVLPAISGYGHEGSWDRGGQVSDAGQMIVVVCIVDPGRVEEIVESVYEFLSRQIGIVAISDVEVIRTDKF